MGGRWWGRKISTVNIVLFGVIYTSQESLQVSLVAHTNQAQREGKPLAGVCATMQSHGIVNIRCSVCFCFHCGVVSMSESQRWEEANTIY